MKYRSLRRLITFLVVFALLAPAAFTQLVDRTPPTLPDLDIGRIRGNDVANDLDKLSPELRTLYEQYSLSKGVAQVTADETGLRGYTSQQLKGIFDINSEQQEPTIAVSIELISTGQIDAIRKLGGSIINQNDKALYVVVPIGAIGKLIEFRTVSSIGIFTALQMPSPVIRDAPPILTIPERGGTATASVPLANDFDKQQASGKGVIIGVIDSGIDWRHEDFIRPDGTSKVIAIWDLMDNSYQTSGGSVGSKPPVYLQKEAKWLGTIYTHQQINAALNGAGTVNSVDRFGHGTAVAGTAAGNGRATANGVPSGTYAGVAPDADLIVVKAMDCGYFYPSAELTAGWMTEYAKSVGKPIVVNMSFGGQYSPHDGSTPGEQFIDSLTGAGKQGKVVTVAAGNDARYNLHASGNFAPKRKGQADQFSSAIELMVKSPTRVIGAFTSTEDWGLAFRSNSPIFNGIDDKPVPVFIYKNGGLPDFKWNGTFKDPVAADAFFKSARLYPAKLPATTDTLQLPLPAGNYVFWGFGTGLNVKDGRFDLYVTESAYLNKAYFGMGTDKTGIVGSPGNSKNAITVGSFDFRNSWINSAGELTTYNFLIGGSSEYSSSGYRRDGLVKPDISAPARYTISPLSSDAKLNKGGCTSSMASGDESNFTKDGLHVSWDGTSAAAPFAAGVIALMFQKNPLLDAEQIRQILKKTAKSGGRVGAVPNPVWGWGMIDPSAAIKAATGPSTVKPKAGK